MILGSSQTTVILSEPGESKDPLRYGNPPDMGRFFDSLQGSLAQNDKEAGCDGKSEIRNPKSTLVDEMDLRLSASVCGQVLRRIWAYLGDLWAL